jgi:hypothetical protein
MPLPFRASSPSVSSLLLVLGRIKSADSPYSRSGAFRRAALGPPIPGNPSNATAAYEQKPPPKRLNNPINSTYGQKPPPKHPNNPFNSTYGQKPPARRSQPYIYSEPSAPPENSRAASRALTSRINKDLNRPGPFTEPVDFHAFNEAIWEYGAGAAADHLEAELHSAGPRASLTNLLAETGYRPNSDALPSSRELFYRQVHPYGTFPTLFAGVGRKFLGGGLVDMGRVSNLRESYKSSPVPLAFPPIRVGSVDWMNPYITALHEHDHTFQTDKDDFATENIEVAPSFLDLIRIYAAAQAQTGRAPNIDLRVGKKVLPLRDLVEQAADLGVFEYNRPHKKTMMQWLHTPAGTRWFRDNIVRPFHEAAPFSYDDPPPEESILPPRRVSLSRDLDSPELPARPLWRRPLPPDVLR